MSEITLNQLKEYVENGYSIKEQTNSDYQNFLEEVKRVNAEKECGKYYKAVARKGAWTIYVVDYREKDESGKSCPQPNADCASAGYNIIWDDLFTKNERIQSNNYWQIFYSFLIVIVLVLIILFFIYRKKN